MHIKLKALGPGENDRPVILIVAETRQGFFCWLIAKGSKTWHRLVRKKWRNCCGN